MIYKCIILTVIYWFNKTIMISCSPCPNGKLSIICNPPTTSKVGLNCFNSRLNASSDDKSGLLSSLCTINLFRKQKDKTINLNFKLVYWTIQYKCDYLNSSKKLHSIFVFNYFWHLINMCSVLKHQGLFRCHSG